MHISHDFIATKTCPTYEFLVFFWQVRFWDRKRAGRVRGGMFCGAGAGKISQTPAGSGQRWNRILRAGVDSGRILRFSFWPDPDPESKIWENRTLIRSHFSISAVAGVCVVIS